MTPLVLSDLHINQTKNDAPEVQPVAGIDCVLFAGDLSDGAHRSIAWLGERFRGLPIIAVLGNHDFYRDGSQPGYTIEEQLDRCRELGAAHGVQILENEVAYVGGARILGATLWTSFDQVPPALTRKEAMSLAQSGRFPDERGRGGTAMNDYRYIHMFSETGGRKRFSPSRSTHLHGVSRRWIESQLAIEHASGPTIVLSHHAPHPESLRELSIQEYQPLDYCYASDLSEILESDIAPECWIHGHIHEGRDYEVGLTRIVANPRGYPIGFGRFENPSWNPSFTIDIEKRLTPGMRI